MLDVDNGPPALPSYGPGEAYPQNGRIAILGPRLKDENRIRFGCRLFLGSQEPPAGILERARLCEKLGFDSVVVDDHLLYGTGSAAAPEPFTTLTAIGLQTRHIKVGVAVTDLIRRHPAVLAQTVATISSLLPKRLFLGLGTGDRMNQTPFGLTQKQSFQILEEGLHVMKMLWASSIEKPANHSGKFFKLKNAYLQSSPGSRATPVYLAAFGKKMLKLAGREADGWIPHCHTPETYRADLETVHSSAKNTGRNLNQFHPAYYTLASASSNREKADRSVLGPAKYFLALIPEGLKKVDPTVNHPGRIWEKMSHPKAQREAIRKIASTIPDKPAMDTVIHGTADDCIEQISRYSRSGCKEYILTFVPPGGLWSLNGLVPMLRLFSAKVIRYFRN